MTDSNPVPVQPSLTALAPNEVHVWSVDLNPSSVHLQDLRSLLSSAESLRIDRLAFPHLVRRFIARRAALRLIASGYLATDPSYLTFQYTGHGKPYLRDYSLSFNLSHSGDLALMVFAQDGRLGVDIELIRPIDQLESVAALCFSPQERYQLGAMDARQRLVAFYSCWTRKEALVKALGKGLFFPLQWTEVGCDLRVHRQVHLRSGGDRGTDWHIRDIALREGFSATLAEEQARYIVRRELSL